MSDLASRLQMPYGELLPPLSDEEFDALKSSIEAEGIHTPILVTEDGKILDGHHRYRIDPNAPRKTVSGLSLLEQKAVVISSNLQRRNLSTKALKALRPVLKELAVEMKQQGLTQEKIAAKLGVARETVRNWLDIPIGQKANTTNAALPDNRTKLSDEKKEQIREQVAAGRTQTEVAAEFGVSQKTVSNVARDVKPFALYPNGPRMSVPDGETVESIVRLGTQSGASNAAAAREIGMGAANYAKVNDVLRLLDMSLSEEDRALCREVMDEINAERRIAPYERLKPLIKRVWGDEKHYSGAEKKRVEQFHKAVQVVIIGASGLDELDIPYLPDDEWDELIDDLKLAERQLGKFLKKMKGIK